MKTVWIVEQGSYSDYHVLGVFSSEENAKLVADRINGSDPFDEATASECPLDPAVKELRAGLKKFYVIMDIDGDVERIEAGGVDHDLEGSVAAWPRRTAPAYKNQNIKNAVIGRVWAKDEKHAIKITNERRIQLIAGGKL